jgi:hypothetical protein
MENFFSILEMNKPACAGEYASLMTRYIWPIKTFPSILLRIMGNGFYTNFMRKLKMNGFSLISHDLTTESWPPGMEGGETI